MRVYECTGEGAYRRYEFSKVYVTVIYYVTFASSLRWRIFRFRAIAAAMEVHIDILKSPRFSHFA